MPAPSATLFADDENSLLLPPRSLPATLELRDTDGDNDEDTPPGKEENRLLTILALSAASSPYPALALDRMVNSIFCAGDHTASVESVGGFLS